MDRTGQAMMEGGMMGTGTEMVSMGFTMVLSIIGVLGLAGIFIYLVVDALRARRTNESGS